MSSNNNNNSLKSELNNINNVSIKNNNSYNESTNNHVSVNNNISINKNNNISINNKNKNNNNNVSINKNISINNNSQNNSNRSFSNGSLNNNNNNNNNINNNNNNSKSINDNSSTSASSKKRKEYDQDGLIKIILPISKRCIYSDNNDVKDSDNNSNNNSSKENNSDNKNNNNSKENNNSENKNDNSNNSNNNLNNSSSSNQISKSSQQNEKKRKNSESSNNCEYKIEEPTSKKSNNNKDNYSTDSNDIQQQIKDAKFLKEQMFAFYQQQQRELKEELERLKDEFYNNVKNQVPDQVKELVNYYKLNHIELDNSSDQLPQLSTYIDQFPGIKILDKIGKGGFGTVYDGLYNGVEVAIKIQKVERSFINEVTTLFQLEHQNICKLMGVFHHESVGCMVLEKMKYSLSQFVNMNPDYFTLECNLDVTSKVINGIANGLEYLHNADICHVDFHPGNILLDDDFNVKIIDFGLSKTIGFNFPVNGACADCFRAPELDDNSSRDDHTKCSDIYQFGLVLKTMIRDAPMKYQDLMKSMLEIDPSKRPSIGNIIMML